MGSRWKFLTALDVSAVILVRNLLLSISHPLPTHGHYRKTLSVETLELPGDIAVWHST